MPSQVELRKIIVTTADNVAVAGVGVPGWSKSFDLQNFRQMGAEIKLASSGSVNVRVDLEQSNTELTAAQEGLTHADWVVPDDASPVMTVIDQNLHLAGMPAAVSRYGRFKFTGLTGNHASTVANRANVAVAQV